MTDIEQFVAKELKFDLESDDVGTRKHALLTLSKYVNHKDVVQLIEGIAERDSSEELRYLARKCLDEYRKHNVRSDTVSKAKPVGGSVVKGIFTYGDREAKLDVIKKVLAMGSDGELPVILEYLEEEKDTWVIASLVKAVGVLGAATHIPRLQPFLEHSDPRVQANTIEAFEAIGDDVVVPLLIPMLSKQDNRIRANAIKALVRYDKEQALTTLEAMARSPKPWQRDSALYCFSMIDGYNPTSIVAEMFAKETEDALLKKEAEVLSSRGEGAVVGQLKRIVDGDDRDRAVLAKYVISKIKERIPNAEKAIQQHQKMSKEEAEKRVARLMKQDDKEEPVTDKAALWPAIALGCCVLFVCLCGYAYHSSRQGDLSRLRKSVIRSARDDRSGPDPRGEFIVVRGKVQTIDLKNKKVLLLSKGNKVLFELKATDAMWKKLQVGKGVTVEAEVTGKTRFGGLYAKGTLTKINGG